MDDKTLQGIYQGEFQHRLKGDWAPWHASYLAAVETIATTPPQQFVTPATQASLWEVEGVAGIGPGRSVAVPGAYDDRELANILLELRDYAVPSPSAPLGVHLQEAYDEILRRVAPYNKRRPRARTVRLLAALRPQDMTCIVDAPRLSQLLHYLQLPPNKLGFVAQHPRIRERLREALGAPTSLKGHVEHAMFCWFLWERYKQATDSAPLPAQRATAAPALTLLPVAAQRRGLPWVKNNVDLLMTVVREAEEGIARPDLVSAIMREATQLTKQTSAVNVISQAQGGLGLIGLEGNAYRPTSRGRELLSSSDASQVLQPLLVERVFGIAHLLHNLQAAPDGKLQQELAYELAGLTVPRRSLWAGNELITWAIAARLASREAGRIALTEDGQAYAEALPADFEEAWRLAPFHEELQEEPEDEAALIPDDYEPLETAAWPTLQARFADGELSAKLIVPEGLLMQLHAALHATEHKRFVLLSGLSGTGKTSITQGYAEAYCRAVGLDWRPRYLQVAVRPDWVDPAGLLGFVNPISDPPSFQSSPLLQFLMTADADPSGPYFLCLDEMNLARVEHYFAPFLAAMEGERGALAIHGEAESIDNVPPAIRWPTNLFIFGTVNMDESTHPFSDKVLDRAFTFEFWDVDLERWAERARGRKNPAVVDAVLQVLAPLQAALQPARRHFGYRTADEVLGFCAAMGGAELASALDAAIVMKVLPRVRGDDSGPLEHALQEMAKALPDEYQRTHAKLAQMLASLKAVGHARFWS